MDDEREELIKRLNVTRVVSWICLVWSMLFMIYILTTFTNSAGWVMLIPITHAATQLIMVGKSEM